jgi:site-specific DNA-adenine methylase
MINEPKKNKGLYEFTEEIKETSIRKHYTKPKPLTETMKRTDFLYCDPPEVILQSKF